MINDIDFNVINRLPESNSATDRTNRSNLPCLYGFASKLHVPRHKRAPFLMISASFDHLRNRQYLNCSIRDKTKMSSLPPFCLPHELLKIWKNEPAVETAGCPRFLPMRKIPRTAKLVSSGPRNFLNQIISKLDKRVVLLPINYRASKNSLFKAKLNVRAKTIQFILNWTIQFGQFAKINNK